MKKQRTDEELLAHWEARAADAQRAYDAMFTDAPPTRAELRRWRQPFAWPDHGDCPRAEVWHQLRHAQTDLESLRGATR
jgi:hypothetical protein